MGRRGRERVGRCLYSYSYAADAAFATSGRSSPVPHDERPVANNRDGPFRYLYCPAAALVLRAIILRNQHLERRWGVPGLACCARGITDLLALTTRLNVDAAPVDATRDEVRVRILRTSRSERQVLR